MTRPFATLGRKVVKPSTSSTNGDPHESLKRNKALLIDIDLEISRLHSERQQAMVFIDEQERFLKARCQIQKLHDDSLFYIFELLVQDYDIEIPDLVSTNKRIIWALAGVCQRWRKVCLDHSRLWRHIILDPDNPDHACKTHGLRDSSAVLRTFLQLERSRDTPLIVVSTQRLCDCTSQASRFRAVAAESHRWEVSIFKCAVRKRYDGMELFRQIFQPNSKLTMLRHMEWNASVFGEELSLPFIDTCSLSNLLHLSLPGPLLSDIAPVADFPWAQLSHLSFDYRGDPHTLITTLSNCQNLLFLKMGISDPRSIDQTTVPPLGDLSATVVLPKLVEFWHGSSPENPAMYLVQSLKLPSLRSAYFGPIDTGEELDSIAELIQRSSYSSLMSTLRLVLKSVPEDTSKFARILRLCPALEMLRFSFMAKDPPELTSKNFQVLLQNLVLKSDDHDSSALCPRLKDLTIMDAPNVDAAILMQVLSSRTRIGGPGYFQRLRWRLPRIHLDDPAYEEAMKMLQFCQEVFEKRYAGSGVLCQIWSG